MPLSVRRPSGLGVVLSYPSRPGMYFCQQAFLPLRLFPVGEPKIESGITAPSRPLSPDLFNAGRGRRFAKPVENSYGLLQPHVARRQVVKHSQRPKADILGCPRTDSFVLQQCRTGFIGRRRLQPFEIKFAVGNSTRNADDVTRLGP